jgi:hypothetical protein
MSRQEEKLKYVDYMKSMDILANSTCTQCNLNQTPSSFIPTTNVIETIGFMPTNRNFNYQDTATENNLLFSITNTQKKELVETDMPQRNNIIENFGSINSNEFISNNTSTSYYDQNNDVLQSIIQEYDRVKDKGEFYTFKSTPRRKNIDLSSYMSPPQKTVGRGFGNVDIYEKIYLGEQTRNNDYRPIVKDSERIPDVPYYLTALPVFEFLGGEDTRFLNKKVNSI